MDLGCMLRFVRVNNHFSDTLSVCPQTSAVCPQNFRACVRTVSCAIEALWLYGLLPRWPRSAES